MMAAKKRKRQPKRGAEDQSDATKQTKGEQPSKSKIHPNVAHCPRVKVALERYQAVEKKHGEDSAEAEAARKRLREVMRIAQERGEPDSAVVSVTSDDDPRFSFAERREVHNGIFAGGIYGQLVKGTLRSMWGKGSGMYDEAHATTVLHARDVLEAMNPRDPMEEMLVAQALWTHARIAKLSQMLSYQTDADHIRMLTESADKASNTYRRLMLALADYRRPPKAGDTITAIQQANIAGQQVIQYGDAAGTDPKKPANEQGCTDATGTEPQSAAPALPADPSGPAFFTGDHPAQQAVGARGGAEDTRREGCRQPERMEAR